MTARPTEQIHPDAPGLHARAADQVLAQALAAQAGAVARLDAALPALTQAALAAAKALNAGGRVAYAGAGSSGMMALADALELSGHFNIPPERTPVLFAGGAAALLHLIGGVEDAARAALDRCEGRVKPAILVARGMAPDQARAALQDGRGHLAPALEQL